ncbi:MAG: hypothetical protein OEY51_14745, partial [Cyclobacteriaceae bacterium]|nr:hypothetical protein [Cyclobacteriaceae bacterium]
EDTIESIIEKAIADEISPTINLDVAEVSSFAKEVLDRFRNPYIHHELKAISLNSIAKFKVRVLPTILDIFKDTGTPPKRLLFVFACLIKLYTDPPPWVTLRDEQETLAFFDGLKSQSANKIVSSVLGNRQLWGVDLTSHSILLSSVEKYYQSLGGSVTIQEQVRILG